MAPKVRVGAAPVEEGPKRGFKGRRPIVVEVKQKKKKRKYTKGTKEFQVAFRRATKITDAVADAVSSGVGRFQKKSKSSSRRRRDGALQDILQNAAAGIGKGLRQSTKAPAFRGDLMNNRSFGKRLVDGVRFLVLRLRGRRL